MGSAYITAFEMDGETQEWKWMFLEVRSRLRYTDHSDYWFEKIAEDKGLSMCDMLFPFLVHNPATKLVEPLLIPWSHTMYSNLVCFKQSKNAVERPMMYRHELGRHMKEFIGVLMPR